MRAGCDCILVISGLVTLVHRRAYSIADLSLSVVRFARIFSCTLSTSVPWAFPPKCTVTLQTRRSPKDCYVMHLGGLTRPSMIAESRRFGSQSFWRTNKGNPNGPQTIGFADSHRYPQVGSDRISPSTTTLLWRPAGPLSEPIASRCNAWLFRFQDISLALGVSLRVGKSV